MGQWSRARWTTVIPTLTLTTDPSPSPTPTPKPTPKPNPRQGFFKDLGVKRPPWHSYADVITQPIPPAAARGAASHLGPLGIGMGSRSNPDPNPLTLTLTLTLTLALTLTL